MSLQSSGRTLIGYSNQQGPLIYSRAHHCLARSALLVAFLILFGLSVLSLLGRGVGFFGTFRHLLIRRRLGAQGLLVYF